jgi:hypothetical protein
MEMRFGLQNVRSLFRELAKYKLDLAGVEEVRWEGGDCFFDNLHY